MRWNRVESLCERGKTTHRLRSGREHPLEREDEVDGRRNTEYGTADQVTLAGHRGTGSGRNRDRAFAQPPPAVSVECVAANIQLRDQRWPWVVYYVAILSGTRSAVRRNDVRRFR